ncbi:hypothetical protein GCM10025762_06390 [Haloechinothrix salitolerans]
MGQSQDGTPPGVSLGETSSGDAFHGVPSYRMLAMLRAVSQHRAEMTCSCEPDLYIDGVTCCDQVTAHDLARYRLIHPMRLGAIGQRVPAGLTAAGHALLAAVPADAA